MIPVFDMINHRNSHHRDVDSNSPHDGDDVIMVAMQDIQEMNCT